MGRIKDESTISWPYWDVDDDAKTGAVGCWVLAFVAPKLQRLGNELIASLSVKEPTGSHLARIDGSYYFCSNAKNTPPD